MLVAVTVFAHGDSDGVCSAALIKAALRRTAEEVKVYFTHPAGFLEDFAQFAQGDVYIADIAIDEGKAEEIERALEGHKGRVVYIDHHPLPEGFAPRGVEVVHRLGASASELTYRYLEESLPQGYDRVALYGAISDYLDHTPWVEEALERWDKRVVYFEAGVLMQGLEGSRRLHDLKRSVVDHLAENKAPSQHQELLARALEQSRINEGLANWVPHNAKRRGQVAYVLDPPGPLGLAATLARGLTGALVGVAAESRPDIYVVSLRAKAGVDLNAFLRAFAKRHEVSAGGHPNAAGARIPKGLLDALIGELNSWLTDRPAPVNEAKKLKSVYDIENSRR
ncbi:MAG: DHHA1 domain-containing protein [Thermoproteus sp.]